MAGRALDGVRVAILVADGFEQVELTFPRRALRQAGAEVEIVSLRRGHIRGVNFIYPGRKVKVDRTVFTADPGSYGALFIPGGFVNPDLLRQSLEAKRFAQAFEREGKPIASLCHGPWVLASAGLVRGRRLASWPGIRDDIENAGGLWMNEPVVHDGNWITSRSPADLALFDPALVQHFSRAPRWLPAAPQHRWQDLTASLRAARGSIRGLLPGRAPAGY